MDLTQVRVAVVRMLGGVGTRRSRCTTALRRSQVPSRPRRLVSEPRSGSGRSKGKAGKERLETALR